MAMRSCDPFDIPVPADLQATLSKLQSAILEQGGTFSGNDTAGKFSGSTPIGAVDGDYLVDAGVIRITITNKPMMAPCGAIEAKIRGYFA